MPAWSWSWSWKWNRRGAPSERAVEARDWGEDPVPRLFISASLPAPPVGPPSRCAQKRYNRARVSDGRSHAPPPIPEKGEPMRISELANLPTRFGKFRVRAVSAEPGDREHLVVLRGRVAGKRRVPLRVHSECLTGDVMGSLRCDCRSQLEKSLRMLARRPEGILLYLRQEGRGIGLMNKIRAYALQERGYDTVEANRLLGFRDDLREYSAAVRILKRLKVRSVALITNNPGKIEALERGGIPVERRIPLIVPANRHNAGYLMTKRARLGHLSAKSPTPAARRRKA